MAAESYSGVGRTLRHEQRHAMPQLAPAPLNLQVGATIREKLVPDALRWFTGEAVEDEPLEFGGDDGEFGALV
jgi:hypothetical protein